MSDRTGQGSFPITRISAIVAAGSADQAERARAFEVLAAAYWMPVYKYIRIKWNKSTEDAKDLTQGFFAEAMEKNFFGRYDASKAKFRTFLRTCLDGFVANDNKSASRLKRGGGVTILSLDFDSAESELKTSPRPPVNEIDEYFEKEWVRSLFSLALESFKAEMQSAGKETHFRLFQRYVLEEPDDHNKISYKDLADSFGLPVTTVTNHLAAARREFRRIVLEKLRELTTSDVIIECISVTTLDADLARVMEPRTSTPQNRLAAIETLAREGVPVGVLAAPIIPGLTDHEMHSIITSAVSAGARYASYVVVRLPYAVKELFETWLEQNFPQRKKKVLNRIRELREGKLNDPNFGSRMRGKGVFAEQIRSMFTLACRKAGIEGRHPELSVDSFKCARRPQLSLFE